MFSCLHVCRLLWLIRARCHLQSNIAMTYVPGWMRFRADTLTIMRCVGGVQSMLATHELLLTDEALMGVLGFNAAQVQHGSTERGTSRRNEPVDIRGPFSYETVADNIVKLDPEKLGAMFNGVIRCIAAQGIFPKQIDAILDATDNEATPSY